VPQTVPMPLSTPTIEEAVAAARAWL